MPDAQLRTKQIIGLQTIIGSTVNVRFNLQRGKIARIWGFNYGITATITGSPGYTLFVRKSPNANRRLTPDDVLWQVFTNYLSAGASHMKQFSSRDIIFPKPYRTTGITVQMHCTINTGDRGALVIYYDIDDMMKGEATQALEKSILKGRTRRTFAKL